MHAHNAGSGTTEATSARKRGKKLERYNSVSDQQPGPYSRWPLMLVHSSAKAPHCGDSLLKWCSDLSTAECQLTNVGAIGDGDGP